MGKNDVNQIADNVRVVHAGCGVNALSGLQSRINSMYCSLLVGSRILLNHWKPATSARSVKPIAKKPFAGSCIN